MIAISWRRKCSAERLHATIARAICEQALVCSCLPVPLTNSIDTLGLMVQRARVSHDRPIPGRPGLIYHFEVLGLRATRMTLSLKGLPRSHRGQVSGVKRIVPEFV